MLPTPPCNEIQAYLKPDSQSLCLHPGHSEQFIFYRGWGVGTIPVLIHSRNLISSSCPGVQNGPYFWWMASLLMPTILPSLCTIDFGFYLLLWVPYSFLLYGDFLFLDLSNMKFSINVVVWSRKEFMFNLSFHPGCKKKKSFWKDGRKRRPGGKIT